MALSRIHLPALPGLQLFQAGRAVTAGGTIEVESNAATPTTTFTLRFSDDGLGAGLAVGGFPVAALIDPVAKRLTLRAGSAAAPLSGILPLGGELELRYLECVVALADGNNDGVLDKLAPDAPIVVTGRVVWRNSALLQLPARLELDLIHDGQRVAVATVNSTPWPASAPAAVLAAKSRLSLRPFVNDGVQKLELTLDGGVGAHAGITALRNRATAFLQQAFGGATSAPGMVAFRLRQVFSLPNGSLSGRQPDWSATRLRLESPPLPSPAVQPGSLLGQLPIQVRIGGLSWDLPFSGPNQVPADWEIRLRDAALGFPKVAGLAMPELKGHLCLHGFSPTDASRVALVFEPTSVQTVNLPDVLRFLLDRLQWQATGWNLGELAKQADLSLEALDWIGQLGNALGGVPSAPALATLLGPLQAIKTPRQVLDILLRAIAGLDAARQPAQWTALAWKWFAATVTAAGQDLHDSLAGVFTDLADLPAQAIERLLAELFKLAESLSLEPGRLITALLKRLADLPRARWFDWTSLCARVVLIAAQNLPTPALLASVPLALVDLLRPGNRLPALDVAAPDVPWQPAQAGASPLKLADWVVGHVVSALALGPLRLGSTAGTASLSGLTADVASGLRNVLGLLENVPAEDRGAPILRMFSLLFAAIDLPRISAPADREVALQREWVLLNLVRCFPATALLLIPASIVCHLQDFPGLLAQWAGKDVLADPKLVTDRRPAPAPGGGAGNPPPVGYLIVSDVHRDAASDDRGPVNFGSIDHFKDNRSLYRKVITWARNKGYTLIENGDSEELWYIREGFEYSSPRAKMEAVFASHAAVYADLWELFLDDRYVRVIGNHDSYLREMMAPETRGGVTRPWLHWKWKETAERERPALAGRDTSPSRSMKLHDFVVIDGVKTMQENSGLQALTDLIQAGADPRAMAANLLKGRLGMDPDDYTEKQAMLICHGHQFDIWNNDRTAVVGKLISNGVGVPVDQAMDPLLDLRGIAMGGSPLVDFGLKLASAPVAGNWLSREAALAMAHRIQHQSDTTRLTIDDVMYSESLAVLLNGLLKSVTQDATRHHHLCIGHTHTPQSQPYYTIPGALAGPLLPVVQAVQQMVSAALPISPDLIVNGDLRLPLRTPYYNTGTSSWFRGVVWAVEILPTGQARLVYFTENGAGPEVMDWELHAIEPAVRQKINALLQQLPSFDALGWLRDQLDVAGQVLGDRMADLLGQFGVDRVMPLPMQALYALDPMVGGALEEFLLEDIDGVTMRTSTSRVEAARRQMEPLQNLLLRLTTLIAQRQAGRRPGVLKKSFRVSVRTQADQAGQLERFTDLCAMFRPLLAGTPAAQRVEHCAAMAFVALNRLPMLGAQSGAGLPDAARLLQGPAPLLSALLLLASQLPGGGTPVTLPGKLTLSTTLNVSDGKVTLSVEVGGTA